MLRNIRIIALASFIEGLFTFLWLASIPTSGTFSPVRLASLFGILIVAGGGLAIFIISRQGNPFTSKIEQVAKDRTGKFIAFALTIISLSLWIIILYKDWLLSFMDTAVYTRFIPVAVLGVLVCLQTGIVFLFPHVNVDKENIFAVVGRPTLILLGCFLAVWVFLSITHLGFVFDDVGLSWGPPGTPISFPQVNLIFVISLLLASVYGILHSKISARIPVRDVVVFIGLWVLTVMFWLNAPVSATHFNPPPMPPNDETYPNSDALVFDKSAYHLLEGTGFNNQLHRRPLYVGLLALFHRISGSGYEETILLQVLVLAFIPSLTYLLTSNLSNRLAGLIAGGLILFREKNAIELSDKIVTSNAKLMMSDMLAMLGVIAFVYVLVKLFSKKENNLWMLAIAGACLGLTALVRAQVLILLPVLLLFILFYRKPFAQGIKDLLLVVLGLALVMSPWIWRNWNLTGTFVLDDRGEERLLARNYSTNPVDLPPPLEGETAQEFSARLKRDIFTFMLEHPSDMAFFVSNHFFRNMATSVVYIAPLLSTASPRDVVDGTLFWESWQGDLNANSGISIFVALTIIALGVATAQTKNKIAGWLPLVLFLAYSAGNALVRSSGWRFSLPVDWIILVYYSIALAYIPSKIKFVWNGNNESQSNHQTSVTRKTGLIVLSTLFLIGASVPIAEQLIPHRDFSNITNAAKEKLSPTELETFLAQDNAILLSGIALYPRYITPNSRIHLADAPPRDFRYLHFWLINDGDDQIVFPTQISPKVFPNTETVSILGCREENYILATVIIVHDQILAQDDAPYPDCSINPP